MAIPYQPAHRIQPTYGFRYGAQPHTDNVAPNYDIPNYEFPENTSSGNTAAKTLDTTQNITSNFEGNEDSDNSIQNASAQLSLNAAQNHPSGRQVHQPYSSPMDALGFLSPLPIQSSPAIPKTGFGAEGTISGRTGGVFKGGRSYDPITGYANQEYSTPLAWRNYMMDDPFENIFGDKNNQFKYDRTGTAEMQEVQFAKAKGLDTDSKEFKQKVLLDKGIPLSSLQGDDNPTLKATDIKNYKTGHTGLVAPKGSQFSITGKFQSGNAENKGPTVKEQSAFATRGNVGDDELGSPTDESPTLNQTNNLGGGYGIGKSTKAGSTMGLDDNPGQDTGGK